MKSTNELLQSVALNEINLKKMIQVIHLLNSTTTHVMVCFIGYNQPMIKILKSLLKMSCVEPEFIREKGVPQTDIQYLNEKVDYEVIREYNFLYPNTKLIFFSTKEPMNLG